MFCSCFSYIEPWLKTSRVQIYWYFRTSEIQTCHPSTAPCMSAIQGYWMPLLIRRIWSESCATAASGPLPMSTWYPIHCHGYWPLVMHNSDVKNSRIYKITSPYPCGWGALTSSLWTTATGWVLLFPESVFHSCYWFTCMVYWYIVWTWHHIHMNMIPPNIINPNSSNPIYKLPCMQAVAQRLRHLWGRTAKAKV